ncbi:MULTISPECIES: glucuronate isomerase [Bacillus]|uniref:Uronate isomerase n=1 Tax=Bacillus pumilus (strain SAFR-032) TaxID=315750 RepID=UXAC_BACP2|nr:MULTISPECIES: glucuronate isomerase [Bacillus]A8FHC4.1 RecName: Full=Uronate isomerase; AltName: Full=Glucuronate isomerase; AltName: Full=Uronic isomerase [Bacillus pumilus SAFR-032]ABV63641.1 glucuronate isomerase [Bacillus pumilus SAFR-032]MBC3641579.1 glucuronate isomerase [Bacillus pumilus]MBC3646249.1 glucuronate isomerase [Bacillus pumilus]MBC3650255.1 glucuronate isomerase [Bacillus pumilus]MBC3652059.1 glucuronate isomerase [Bacillus pumilus]
MKAFLNEQFLLNSPTAEKLYHEFAKDLPIIDYHCHLSPKDIYENKTFRNITEAWLYGDHYKWRAMRANGIPETHVTGDASDYDKFLAWAKTVPMTIGNPLYHWTHLELRRYFEVQDLLNEKNADTIWQKVNEKLQEEGFGARDFIMKSNVETVVTTDDPIDSLQYHQKLREEGFSVQVLPGFRPDKALDIANDLFEKYVHELAEASAISIQSYQDFLNALRARIDFFHEHGCLISDHAINEMTYEETTQEEVETIFHKRMSGYPLTEKEKIKFKTETFIMLGQAYCERGWAMQLHINALRNNNTKMFERLGPDTGYDAMNDEDIAKPLCRILDRLEQEDALPNTILYSLNPRDNVVISTLAGSFQDGKTPGKMQHGTAWWFNDTKQGMTEQMMTLSSIGLISRFIGMLTDSRSFLSYTRHEYFRRLLCDIIGDWVEKGEVPYDLELLGEIVKGISYENAKQYFQFDRVKQLHHQSKIT